MVKLRVSAMVLLAGALVFARPGLVEAGDSTNGNGPGDGADLIVIKIAKAQRVSNLLNEELGKEIKKLPGVAAVEGVLVDIHELPGVPIVPIVYFFGREPGSLPRDGKLTQGRPFSEKDKRKIAIGNLLARTLGKKVGDRLDFLGIQFEILAVYESRDLLENSGAMLPLREMQELLERPKKVSAFHVRVEDSHKSMEKVVQLRGQIESLRDRDGKSLGLAVHLNRDYLKKAK